MAEFNATDLRVRIQSSFSAFEMRRLLESWGAAPEEIDGDPGTLAHRVVRIGYKRFGLGELVHKLRAEKPLTEWPDPGSEPDDRWAGPPSISETAAQGFTAETPRPPVAKTIVWREADTVVPGQAPLEDATQLDLEVPEMTLAEVPPPSQAPASRAPSSRRDDERPPPSRGLLFVEPEVFRQQAKREKKNTVDARVPLIAGGVAVVLVAIAFGAGLMWQRRGRASAGEDASEASEEQRSRGPAGRAANIFDDGLRRVADTCGLDVVGEPTTEVFALAQEACGREETIKQERERARARARAAAKALDFDTPDPPPRIPPPPPIPVRDRLPLTAQPVDAPKAPPRRDPDDRPAPPPKPTGGGCTAKCSSARADCDKSCGPEPSDASNYGAFQACTSRCISADSRCRRNCF